MGKKWRGITNVVAHVAEVEPKGKVEERSKLDRCSEESFEDAGDGGKEIDHGGRRAQRGRSERKLRIEKGGVSLR